MATLTKVNNQRERHDHHLSNRLTPMKTVAFNRSAVPAPVAIGPKHR